MILCILHCSVAEERRLLIKHGLSSFFSRKKASLAAVNSIIYSSACDPSCMLSFLWLAPHLGSGRKQQYKTACSLSLLSLDRLVCLRFSLFFHKFLRFPCAQNQELNIRVLEEIFRKFGERIHWIPGSVVPLFKTNDAARKLLNFYYSSLEI